MVGKYRWDRTKHCFKPSHLRSKLAQQLQYLWVLPDVIGGTVTERSCSRSYVLCGVRQCGSGYPHQSGQVYGLPGGLPVRRTLTRFKSVSCRENFDIVDSDILEMGCTRSGEFLAKTIPIVDDFYPGCFGWYCLRNRLVVIIVGGYSNPVG